MEWNPELAKLIWNICQEECEKVNQMTHAEKVRELLIILKSEERWKKKLAREQKN